ncbi:MAG: aminoglycoside 6'-N-acetyltransferase [Bacilli bacterium]
MIRRMQIKDLDEVTKMALLLWPNHTYESFREEVSFFYRKKNMVYFVAENHKKLVGFAQCQIRNDYVEGTDSNKVGYLEGIFIIPEFRKQNYGTSLVNACEKWAKDKSCSEFASDCELDNHDSFHFHLKCGFSEANRIICFTKKL